MDCHGDACSFSKPVGMFKTLRRLHGHNLENSGLNDLSEAFQNFMTRARFFSVGRLRRTWSHSALEFLKYRRLLPMLTSDQEIGSSDFANESNSYPPTSSYAKPSKSGVCGPLPSSRKVRRDSSVRTSRHEERKIIVMNISPRVTTNQLKSFFSKFGPISSCQIPSEQRRNSLYATLTPKSRSSMTAFIIFRTSSLDEFYIFDSSVKSAEKAINAVAEELKFYDQVMSVAPFSVKKECSIKNSTEVATVYTGSVNSQNIRTAVPSHSASVCSLTDVASFFGSSLSLSILPEKVLTLILSYLPPVDRIRSERVSKCFLESSVESWKLTNTLLFSNDSIFGRTFSSSNPLRNMHLKALLSRCGVHLKCLDLSRVVNLLDEGAFQIISLSCPNLVEVNLSGLSCHWRAVRTFAEPLKNLRSITYKNMVNISDKTMWYLFKPVGMNIREVDLRGCRRFKGRCFKLFGDQLQKIFLDGCYRLDKQSLEELCFHSPNIIELRLSGCRLVSDDILSLISRNLQYLKSFALCGDCFVDLTPVGLMALTRLHFLHELWLDYNSLVSDQLLEAIFDNLTCLRLLSLAHAGSDATITKEVASKIAKLTELETLNVSSLAAVTNNVLSSIASGCSKLRIFRARCCTYLGEEGVCSLTMLKNLEHVDLSGCLLVTSKCIQTLLDSFTLITNSHAKQTVTVVIGGTICNIQSLRKCNSRVVVDTSDYSEISADSARDLFPTSSVLPGIENNSSESSSDGEFDALTTHRSFIIDALDGLEDDSLMEAQKSIDEWAEREALDLGLIIK